MPANTESQYPIYSKNKPGVTTFQVHSRFTTMTKTFGEQLREQLQARNMRAAELARRSGVTKQGIGRLINNTPHGITGALPQPERETVEKIARALDWDLSEALLAAGYAPSEPEDRFKLPDGVMVSFESTSHLTDEQKDKIVNVIRTLVAGVRAEND